MMLPPLREFSYLTAQNAPVYRVLMRLLHEASVMQQRHVAPEDLLARARDAGLHDLTPGSLQSHLDALVEWGNVGQRRDTARVESLSEYARRRNLYHATARGLAIEDFLESGLDAAEETAAVSAGTVSRLETQWGELTELLEAGKDEEFELAWTALYRDFRALSEDVRALTVSLERQLSLDDLEQFLEFKGVVRSYVERLAAELAGPGQRLRALVQAFGREEALVETLTRVRAGRLTRGATLLAEAQAKETAGREWESLRGWLTRPPEQGDGLEFGITALRGAVAQVLAFIEAVRRTHELGLGRAGELAEFAAQLDDLPSAAAAREELSRHFGTASPLHVPGSDVRDQAGPPWSTALEPLTLHPVRRGRAPAPVSPGIPEPSSEVRAQLAEAFRIGQQRQQALLDLFTEGTLTLHQVALPDDLLPDVLAWISEGFKAAQEQEAGLSDGVAHIAGPLGHRAEVVLTRQPATLQLHSGRRVHIERGARVVLS